MMRSDDQKQSVHSLDDKTHAVLSTVKINISQEKKKIYKFNT